MQTITIAQCYDMRLISVGNGAAYEFWNAGESIFVQGDDATQLREEWEAIESAFPLLHTKGALLKLWELYQ